MNPIIGAVLIIAALSATYVFAAKGIQAGAEVTAVLGAGIALLQGKSHAATAAALKAATIPPPPGAP